MIDEDTRKELIRLERMFVDSHTKSNTLSHAVLDRVATIGNDTHEIKQNLSKDKFITYGIIAIACMLIGTQYKTWLPYADSIVTTVKKAREMKQ